MRFSKIVLEIVLKICEPKIGLFMPLWFIQSLFSTKKFLPEMCRVAKNISPEFLLDEAFLAVTVISENKFFVIQRVWINPKNATKPDFRVVYFQQKRPRYSTPTLNFLVLCFFSSTYSDVETRRFAGPG